MVALVAPMLRRLLLLILVSLTSVLALASPAFAHNSLDTSTPADGEVVTVAPTAITFGFTKDVPLETLTVTLTDPSGVRTDLPGSTHGPNGTTQVVTPLPVLADGPYTVRWRLVSPDGHAISGRVEFTMQLAAVVPGSAGPESVVPSPTTAQPTVAAVANDGDWSLPGWVRWLLRFGSYLAIMVVAGLVITEAFVWREVARVGVLRWITEAALALVALGAFGQLLVIAGDIAGSEPWTAWSAVGTATETDAGMALVLRIVLVAVTWLLVVHDRPTSPQIYSYVLALLSLAMLATWSFAGHARSMRWPWIGVPIDVVHHGSAASWIGGLAVVGLVAIPRSSPGSLVAIMHRFSRLAAASVAAIVITGVVQSFRLVGGPSELFGDAHGRLLIAKVAALGVMLVLADANRRRVNRRFREHTVDAGDVSALRRVLGAELAMGLAIVGLTASLVASPPASSNATAPQSRQPAATEPAPPA